MRNKKPPFEITEAALSDVMAIGELVGKISSTQQLSSSPILRRENRIKNDLFLSCNRAKYSFFGTGDCCSLRQACACTTERHCRGQKCL